MTASCINILQSQNIIVISHEIKPDVVTMHLGWELICLTSNRRTKGTTEKSLTQRYNSLLMHCHISLKIATHSYCSLKKRSIRSSMFCMHHPLLLTTEPFHKVMIGGRGGDDRSINNLQFGNPHQHICKEFGTAHTWSNLCKDHRSNLTWEKLLLLFSTC